MTPAVALCPVYATHLASQIELGLVHIKVASGRGQLHCHVVHTALNLYLTAEAARQGQSIR